MLHALTEATCPSIRAPKSPTTRDQSQDHTILLEISGPSILPETIERMLCLISLISLPQTNCLLRTRDLFNAFSKTYSTVNFEVLYF